MRRIQVARALLALAILTASTLGQRSEEEEGELEECEGTDENLLPAHIAQSGLNSVIICEFTAQRILCPRNEEVTVLSAVYGRTQRLDVPLCITTVGVDNCMLDVEDEVSDQCDERRGCCLFADNSQFDEPDPCQGVRKYINFTFECADPDFEEVTPTTPDETTMTTARATTTRRTTRRTIATTTTEVVATTTTEVDEVIATTPQPAATEENVDDNAMLVGGAAANGGGPMGGAMIAVIVGAVVAGIALIACALAAFLLRRKTKKRRDSNTAAVFDKYLKVTQSRSLPAQNQTALGPLGDPDSALNPAPEGQGPFGQARKASRQHAAPAQPV